MYIQTKKDIGDRKLEFEERKSFKKFFFSL